MQPRTGVLVVNLGSPDAPDTAAVRRYLAEFLSDERVLDINPLGRWLLLHLIILRTRPAKSAEAYQKIWTPEGSPLLVHGHALVEALGPLLPDLELALAMRYGNPSIAAGLDALRARGCDNIVIFPLYPQYAASSTGTALEVVYRELSTRWNTPYVSVVPPFFDDAGFIGAFAAVARPILDDLQPDHVLLSFHGLPERHMRKSDESGRHCLAAADCCATLTDANRNCYRAQCFATARGLAAALGLTAEDHTVCFQSRLGRTPWIQPYTDEVLATLPARGVRKLAVLCPAFTADCLETLEEIGMRADEDFRAAGGTELRLVPSLNAHPTWVQAAADLIRRTAPAGDAVTLPDARLDRLPVFPLAEVYLFPGTLLPLHLFEPRYVSMLRHCLSVADRALAIANLEPGYEADYAGRPPIRSTLGAGIIIAAHETPEHTWNIVLRGLERVEVVEELPPLEAFREVRARRLPAPAAASDARAYQRLRLLVARVAEAAPPARDALDMVLDQATDAGTLAHLLAAHIIAEPAARRSIFEATHEDAQVAIATDAIAGLLLDVGTRDPGTTTLH